MSGIVKVRETVLETAITLAESIAKDMGPNKAAKFGRNMLLSLKNGNSITILNNWINIYNRTATEKIEKFNESAPPVKVANKVITPGSIITFGKHEGLPAGSVPAKYLLWADVDIEWFVLDDEFREGLKIQKQRDDEAAAQAKMESDQLDFPNRD